MESSFCLDSAIEATEKHSCHHLTMLYAAVRDRQMKLTTVCQPGWLHPILKPVGSESTPVQFICGGRSIYPSFPTDQPHIVKLDADKARPVDPSDYNPRLLREIWSQASSFIIVTSEPRRPAYQQAIYDALVHRKTVVVVETKPSRCFRWLAFSLRRRPRSSVLIVHPGMKGQSVGSHWGGGYYV